MRSALRGAVEVWLQQAVGAVHIRCRYCLLFRARVYRTSGSETVALRTWACYRRHRRRVSV